MTTRTTKDEAKATTFQDFKDAIEKIRGKPSYWLLTAPNGDVWRGEPEELMRVLVAYTPLTLNAFEWPEENRKTE